MVFTTTEGVLHRLVGTKAVSAVMIRAPALGAGVSGVCHEKNLACPDAVGIPVLAVSAAAQSMKVEDLCVKVAKIC
jgi:hypothetical protein